MCHFYHSVPKQLLLKKKALHLPPLSTPHLASMARKRRAPSPTPPPPSPPQQSSGSESDTEDEERSPRTLMPPQSPQSHSAAAESDGSEEESDSDAQPESDAEEEEEEEEGDSSESEPEAPEPVLKKALASKKTNTSAQKDKKKPAPASAASGSKLKEKGKVDGPQTEPDPDEEEEGESSESEQQDKTAPPAKKTVAQHNKKRPAPEAAPSGKAKKKAKADAGIVEHEATPTGNGKEKAEAEPEKVPHVQTRSATANKLGDKLDKSGIDPSSSSKSAQVHRWSNKDTIKILETLAAYVEREAKCPENKVLYLLVADYLEREDCTLSDLYEKVRSQKRKYERGFVPVGDYERQLYQLSDAIWGQKAQEAIAAAASRGTEVVEVEADRNGKIKLSKEDTATATQNGDALRNGKGRKADKEALTGNHNAGAGNEEESHEGDAGWAVVQGIQRNNGFIGNQNGGTGTEHAEGRAIVQGAHRDFHELQKLYPSLADCVERLGGRNLCRETLKMAFGFIGDEEAKTLESSMEAQKKSEALTEACRLNIKAVLLKMLLEKVG